MTGMANTICYNPDGTAPQPGYLPCTAFRQADGHASCCPVYFISLTELCVTANYELVGQLVYF